MVWMYLGIALFWTLIGLTFLCPFVAMYLFIRGWWAFTPRALFKNLRICGVCSYSLRNLASATCPECGADVSRLRDDERARMRALRARFEIRCMIVSVVCVTLGILAAAIAFSKLFHNSEGLFWILCYMVAWIAWPVAIAVVAARMRRAPPGARIGGPVEYAPVDDTPFALR